MSTSVKILVVGNYSNFISARPEAEIYLSLASKGFQIEIITDITSEYAKRFKAAGISIIDHTPKKKISKATIKLFKETLSKGKHDAFVLYNSKAITNGLIAAKNINTKVILYRGCAGHISWLDPTMYFKYLNKRVDHIICNAKSAQSLFEKQLTFDNKKAITIHKGHDVKWYEDVPNEALDQFNVPEDAFVVCCVANARPVKGVQYLLKAFNAIPVDYPIYLLLIGNGHDTKKHLSIMQNCTNKDKIKLLGFRKDSLSIVKSSNCFVLPSIGQETLTKSVIESMCVETTPIITNVAGNKALVIHNESGLIVPVKDSAAIARAIMDLYKNSEKNNQLATSAKKRIEQTLSHSQTVTDYSNFFRSLKKHY